MILIANNEQKEKLLLKLLGGVSDANFDIEDLAKILDWFGFEERKASGSHRIFSKEGIGGIINLQKAKDGKAKTFQVKQMRDFLVTRKSLVMKNKYEVIIFWSNVDNVFIAEIPELEGCTAFGDTQNEALKEVNIVAKEWLALAKEKGWQIPEPKGRLMFA